jgi:tetratricopeptide (TPR) repeat protein
MRATLSRVVLAVFLCAGSALACLWDYDTLEMERQRFPDVLEVIAGKVLRHSRAFYAWRAKDRERRLAATPGDLALLDDLIVAQSKLDRHEDAIATARRALALAPRRYETLSNLGTVLLLAGHASDGLPYLKTALEVNPDAHFGREKYQVALVEYLLARGARPRGPIPGAGLLLPLQLDADEIEVCTGSDDHRIADVRWRGRGATNFAVALSELDDEQLAAAVKGVCGMLVFANGDSPILLEVLGDLLSARNMNHAGGEQRLAARAYLRAALGVEEPARSAYRALARGTLATQSGVSLASVEADLAAELEDGRRFVAGIEADEAAWIAGGKDPEVEFASRYYAAPVVGAPAWLRVFLDQPRRIPLVVWLPGSLIVLLVVVHVWQVRRRRRAVAAAQA